MKTFDQLTKEEKVTLTGEEVQYYAKIDCANRGIIIPQKPINTIKDVIPPTQKYYQVGYESFVFETDKEAQDYIDAKGKALQVKSIGNSYDDKNKYVSERNSDYKDFKSITLYSKEEATELKTVLEYNAETSKEWKEYNESLFKYNEVEASIWEEINEINFRNSREMFYDKVYSDYLTLADDNHKIAYTFFDKAYRNISLNDLDRDIVDKILNTPIFVESEKV